MNFVMNTDRRIHPTSHPHIVKIDGVCGGQAVIQGTRVAVWHIVDYYYKIGMSAESMSMEWDYISPAQIFSALAYYHDNKDEIDEVRRRNTYEYWKKHHASA